MLIVALRKLTDKQKNNLKQYYKTIVFDKRLHLRKNIKQLQCEVLIVEIDLSRVFRISKNIVLKWLKSQNITDILTSFIYESSKYKKLFDKNVNYFVRSFPELFQKNIEETVRDKQITDDNVKSKYEAPTEEEEEEQEEEKEINTEGLTLEMKISILEKRLSALERLLEPPKLERQTAQNVEIEIIETKPEEAKPEYTMEEQPNKIVIKSNNVDIQSYPFKNKIEKRKVFKKAQKYFNYLLRC
jgi:hypothetical protein